MGSSGVGRGRGWLNLNKENRNRPGLSPQDTINNELQWSKTTILTSPVQQYANLISLISQISGNDDGILLNQKLKAIIETWERDCSSSNEVVESFQYLYNKCLEDENLVLKVVIMISSYTFMTTPISGEFLRPLFIRHMQNTYDNGKQLQSGSPVKFRNAVKMLGEYFNRAKLINGQPINVLITPLLCYFEMLLDTVQPADLELFATQLYLTGSSIKTSYQQQLNDLINKVRKVLITNGELTKTCRLYLLLIIEIADNRFSLIPSDVHSFYQEQLGEQVMAQFQGALGALSIQTQQSNKTLDGYQSAVNVLQVSPTEPSSPVNDQIQNQQQNQQHSHSQSHQQIQQSQCQQQQQPQSQQQQSQPQKQNQQHLGQQQQQQQQHQQQQHQQQHQKKIQQQQNSLSSNSQQNKQSNQNYSTNNYNTNEIGSYGNWDDNKDKPNNNTRTEKTGRPILGSGARLKNKDKDGGGGGGGGGGSNWRDLNKDGSGGGQWGGGGGGGGGDKTGTFWREKKPPPKSYRKGWEHDDRFSTDYN